MFNLQSKITIKIFGYFFVNPHKKHYINELAGLLEVDPGNLFRKLKELEQEGVLVSEIAGNQKYFFLNKAYPLLKELKKIYEAKYGLVAILQAKLEKLSGLKRAYIFGSYAKGNLSAQSDIDLLLVGEHSSLEAKKIVLPLQRKLKREINIIDLTLKELERRQKQKDDFLQNVFSGQVIELNFSE
ncbi:nucleotidyltransferase domain-containing protein [Candidatus Parcubacteria bacterium]|nr:nucleotidyltransferase domain-containing protein [Candidatus Parcubacteria bacterium]